ncbi:MAG: glycosyltransferase family 2 protein [Acidimicrobiales bacterium]
MVATRDRRRQLLSTLHRLRAAAPASPIVVVDNASTDGTASAVGGAFPEITVVAAGRNLGAAGRTLGARHATTPYVAFSDDDSWWAPGSLERGVRTLDQCPTLGLVGARILVGAEERLDPTSAAMRDSPLPADASLPGPPVLGFLACAAVVRRAAFLAVGGFHEAILIAGEEELLAIDLATAGWRLAYLDDMVAHHHPSELRDHGGRRRRQRGNALVVAWLRRPLHLAAGRTAAGLSARDPITRAAARDALRALPAALAKRRVVDPGLERQLRLLERVRSEHE